MDVTIIRNYEGLIVGVISKFTSLAKPQEARVRHFFSMPTVLKFLQLLELQKLYKNKHNMLQEIILGLDVFQTTKNDEVELYLIYNLQLTIIKRIN